jgi:hypothetical protein
LRKFKEGGAFSGAAAGAMKGFGKVIVPAEANASAGTK